jgi:ankyrin repeat protein
MTPRCECGYPSSFHSFNCFHSIPILLRMQDKGRPEYTPTIQAILRMLQEDPSPEDTANSQAGQIESSLVKALLSLCEKPNFDDIVSTSNDSSQTLAHLSILYGYITLLRHLVEWGIDLTVADISGLTALHCAYLKEDRESIRILLRGGAPSSIEDKLGRLPRDLVPEGSDLADWPGVETGTGEESPPIEHPMDHEIALGEQFTVLEAEWEHENSSSHGELDSDSDASSNSDGEPRTPTTTSPLSHALNGHTLYLHLTEQIPKQQP